MNYLLVYFCVIIYSDSWNTDKVTDSDKMFTDCNSLVGGNGTAYATAGVTDASYAHVDVADNPGYFTERTTEAYAVYTSDNTTLTFYYDKNKSTREGAIYSLNESGDPAWRSDSTSPQVTRVVFDPSFADARPTCTNSWFCDMSNLENISGLDNLNTSEVTSMLQMFAAYSKLTSLDLSGWDVSKVDLMLGMFEFASSLKTVNLSGWKTTSLTSTSHMFRSCTSLTTVYVDSNWSTANVVSSAGMFDYCTALVGGQGTTYDADHVDATYAHIDGGASNPGYFTAAAEAYAVHNETDYILTFYYDNQRTLHTDGTVHSLNTGGTDPGWFAKCHYVDYVIFDPSFVDARPTSTYNWFCDMAYLQEIRGLEYLNTSEVTIMTNMFYGCNNSSFTSLDLSHFNTKKVKYMSRMFQQCSKLKTIYVSNDWSTANVTSSTDMFTGCSVLVGGNGTTYSSSHVNAAYARIDAAGTPGYFTYKESFLLGDVNGDGSITIADVTALVNIILGKDTENQYNHQAADVNSDGSITIADVTALVNIILVKN